MKASHLLRDRHFWPLFWTQFCGAFNDNVFKFALIGLIVSQGQNLQVLSFSSKDLQAFASGLFILPFFLFSAMAGQYADKYDKSKIIRLVKIFEIFVMSLAVIGFLTHNIHYLLVVIFLMGAQSTLFGPVKYSILPQHIDAKRLTSANGYVEMGTFIAILVGTILGTFLIEIGSVGAIIISCAIMSIAILGYFFSRFVPPAPPCAPDLKISYNFLARTYSQVKHASNQKEVFVAIIGISWFWFLGAVLLTLIQPLAKEVFHGDVSMRILLLSCTTIGIGLGSVLCGLLTHNKLSNHLVPIGALGLSLFGADLYFSSQALVGALSLEVNTNSITSLPSFLSTWHSYRLLLDLFLFGIFAGFYIVPLYVILQIKSPDKSRSRNIAVNNIMNALFMVTSAILTVVMFRFGFSITEVLLAAAVLNVVVCLIIFSLMPVFITELLDFIKLKLKQA